MLTKYVLWTKLLRYVTQKKKQTPPLRSSRKIKKTECKVDPVRLRPPLARNSRQPIYTKYKSTKCYVLHLGNYADTSLQSPTSELYLSTSL